jgi:DNA-binding CsgD family transcriptional regulator
MGAGPPTTGDRGGQRFAPDVEALVRRLLAVTPPPTDPQPVAGHSLVLDIEVDGARYQLVRYQQGPPPTGSLTPRELEIARMVAKGYPNKTIAAVLAISTWTVSSHLRRIFAKIGVSSRAAMVARLSGQEPLGEAPPDDDATEPAGQAP